MTNKAEAIIFDMDGTLYQFPGGGTFMQVPFGQTIQRNVQQFIAREFALDEPNALKRYDELQKQFNGEMSLGLEREFGIDRMRFFAATWDVNPSEFIVAESDLRDTLAGVEAELVLLSAAPRVWVDRVLGYMGVAELFGERIFTGEPDIRKPNPLAFQQILDTLGLTPEAAVSVGDQEYTDIIPAQSLGLATVRIGTEKTAADIQAYSVADAIAKMKDRNLL